MLAVTYTHDNREFVTWKNRENVAEAFEGYFYERFDLKSSHVDL